MLPFAFGPWGVLCWYYFTDLYIIIGACAIIYSASEFILGNPFTMAFSQLSCALVYLDWHRLVFQSSAFVYIMSISGF